MWTSAWQSHRYGDGCGVSVLGLGGAVFTLSQHAFASDREWGRQRRREENAQMSTKAKVTAAGEHILSFARRNHVPDDTWSAACRLYVIGPPRALSHTGTSAMILLYMLWTLYVQIHRCSLRQILNSVPFPVPRVTFVSSLHTKVVVPCPAVFIAPPPLAEKWSPPNAAHIPSMGKMLPWCFDLMGSLCVYILQCGNICILQWEALKSIARTVLYMYNCIHCIKGSIQTRSLEEPPRWAGPLWSQSSVALSIFVFCKNAPNISECLWLTAQRLIHVFH